MQTKTTTQPLADRIRPTSLGDFIGQSHLVGEDKPLYQAIKNKSVHSMILWGPPGVGKTTLARIIAGQTDMNFIQLSAVSASKNDIRELVTAAQAEDSPMEKLLRAKTPQTQKRGILLFLDEIHRFNKAQQDFLLPYVEDGTVTLIGATTENPSFEVIAALLSRCQVFVLQSLSEAEVHEVIQRGAEILEVYLLDDAADFLAAYANGDGRHALNLLEAVVGLYAKQDENAQSERVITLDNLKNALQSKHLRYDKAQEEHYNTISAYIKSMRAGDADAALYYLARMVAAGEDPVFIARRMVIFASEDIGLAQPTALVVANAVFQAVTLIGYPECQINLAHGTAYLALASKDRSSYDGFFEALEDVNRYGNLEIPMQLRNAPTQLMKELGYGKPGAEGESLLPEKINTHRYLRRNKL